jgi:hypothetical protein
MHSQQQIIDQLKHTCEQAAQPLHHVATFGAESVHEFSFDLSTMRDFSNEDIRKSPEHSGTFDRLAKITGPVVYVFEVVSNTTAEALLSAAQNYSGSRATPAHKKWVNHESRILYVGKVKRNFWGRVIQHLGFYKVAATQGLQLFHWAPGLELEVKLTVFEFQPAMVELLLLLENTLAAYLKPLIGKHK